jgi:hypothetical protein
MRSYYIQLHTLRHFLGHPVIKEGHSGASFAFVAISQKRNVDIELLDGR